MFRTLAHDDGWPDIDLRPVCMEDATRLADAYIRNRSHLAPWDPARSDEFYTSDWQRRDTANRLAAFDEGTSLSLVLATDSEVIGRANLSGITRGAFESASVGYWVDAQYAGRGLISAAVEAAVEIARDDLGLHRLEAGTLVHNHASQRVLQKVGFEYFGLAPRYLRIAGEWQDHKLFQRILHD